METKSALHKLFTGCFILFVLAKMAYSEEACTDRQIHVTFSTNDTKCCDTCKRGSGATVACSPTNDTQCEPCIPGKTFNSDPVSYDSTCRACATCDNNTHFILHPCNATHNTLCVCPDGSYYDPDTDKCRFCELCGPGYGAAQRCGNGRNTVCEACVANVSYSNRHNYFTACTPCSTCSEEEVMLKACTETEDTICFSKHAGRGIPAYNYSTPTVYHEQDDDNGDIIPVYCAALGLVVVGLFGYVIFKHWRRMQAKRRQKAPCSYEDVEYSKASGADSGVYVENDSPKNHQYCLASKVRDLPHAKRKEVEKILLANQPDSWIVLLAKELGYSSRKLGQLNSRDNKREPHSRYKHMIREWERSDLATVSRLTQCLRNIGRDDAARVLYLDTNEARTQAVYKQNSNVV